MKETSCQKDLIYGVWQTTRSSKEGVVLDQRERWERYKPDSMTEIGNWQKILGYDVNNLKHMRLTDFTTIDLVDLQNQINPGSFNQEEKDILRKTALVHDLAEAVEKDISFELKTENDEKKELKIIRQILSQDNFAEVINNKEREQIISILKDKESKLGETFNVIESIGYFRTAMVTWRKSKLPEHQSSGVSENLILITNNVLLNNIPKLVEKSKKFVLVEKVLDFYSDRICDAFENMPAEVFDKYEPEYIEKNRQKFETARNVWSNYLATKNN